jgi:hypothetical protein
MQGLTPAAIRELPAPAVAYPGPFSQPVPAREEQAAAAALAEAGVLLAGSDFWQAWNATRSALVPQ